MIDPSYDYIKIIRAVIDNAMTTYIKLQHPLNRHRKDSMSSYLEAVDMFFDKTFRFEHFKNESGNHMTTKELLSKSIDNQPVNMKKAQTHVVEQSIEYWWEKHFHDFKVPETFVIAGKLWKIKNSPQNKSIDTDNCIIYMPTKDLNADRIYIQLVLQILCYESGIEIQEFEKFHKYFYLFLKVNNAFPLRKK